jgi:ribosomal protein S18 acetylase RimI-like enzyme
MRRNDLKVPERVGDPAEINYRAPERATFGPLARDRIPVRSMEARDLPALVAIDRQITGRDRGSYLQRKLHEALHESDVCVSVLAEYEGVAAGYLMAQVHVGEFGLTEPTAEIDTIGVAPAYRAHGIGRAMLSQLLANLGTLRVERILTEVEWDDPDLLGFLAHCGFTPSSRLAFVADSAP